MPVALSVSLGACAGRSIGSSCSSSADCDDGLLCVVPPGQSEGTCIDPLANPDALPPPPGPGPQLSINKDIDILFVIDNSGSMGEEQALLAQNFGAFINVLEADGVEANYRIGITTTDNGNDWCPAGQTTPEGGKLVLSSCKERLGDFIFNNGEVNVQDLACNDICGLNSADLEILPTTTDVDPNPAPRPWLENIEGRKNIPEGTVAADAFRCFGPQGINGCGFESPLESMYLSLIRAQDSNEESYGFLRYSAILAIIIVSDEADCSYNRDWSEIFSADGNKVFWSDPNSAFPSSAVCWNAGVECVGDPSAYDDCYAVNKDVNGNVGVSDADAVLHPMSRYSGLLNGLEVEKQQFNAGQELIVGLIGGVLPDGTLSYVDVGASDPAFQDAFGIGPGCVAPPQTPGGENVTAVPPVRMRELVDEFTPGNMFSICETDYSPALEEIADAIRAQLPPACYTQCVADTDPSTEIVEPSCTLEQDPPGNDNTEQIPECVRAAEGYETDEDGDYLMPSDADNVCFAMLVDSPDAPLTSTPSDDMVEECLDQNFNLQFEIVRRPGFPAPGGTSVSATCTLADFPEVQCPGIGG